MGRADGDENSPQASAEFLNFFSPEPLRFLSLDHLIESYVLCSVNLCFRYHANSHGQAFLQRSTKCRRGQAKITYVDSVGQ